MSNSSRYHHGDLKPALIEAAREILRTGGADALSLRSIAAAIGVSHMAPYAHFKSKRELLRAVAASGFDELAERMLAVQGRQNRKIKGRELAVKYGVEYLRFALESPAFYKVMMSQLEPTPGPPARSAPDKQTPEETIQGAPESVPDAAPPGPGQAASRSPMPAAIRVSLRRPFLLLYGAFASGQLDKKTAQARAIGAWATVHGMAALIIDGHLAVPEGMDAIDLFQAAVGDKL